MNKKHVVILGAGYAGLKHYANYKRRQRRRNYFVDRNNYHYEATDLHEVAAGTQPAEKITYNIMNVVDEK